MMEEATSGPTTPPKPELRDLMWRRWINLRSADAALQLEKDARRQQICERLITKAQDGTLGTPTADAAADEEMAVHVGDTYVSPQTKQPRRSRALELGMAAALLLGGGAAASVPFSLLMAAMNRPVAPVNDLHIPVIEDDAPPAPDQDTQFGIRFFRE
jgi:hypothetical protein